MARKSKGFQELLKQKKSSQAQQKSMESLKKKIQNSALGELVSDVVIGTNSAEKMSEILHEFISPYLRPEYNLQRRKSILGLAAIAWNSALLVDKQLNVDDFLEKSLIDHDAETKEDVKKFVHELIARKIEYFSDIKRLIVNFEITESGEEYNISVASTPIENAK